MVTLFVIVGMIPLLEIEVNLMEEINAHIERLAQDTARGATDITIDAVELAAQAAVILSTANEWPQNLRPTIEKLIAIKPTMASLVNACQQVYFELAEIDGNHAFSQAPQTAKKIVANLTQALHQSAANCAQMIPEDATVLTCSSSSSVLKAVQMVHRVVIYAPDGNQQMANMLANHDIPSELVGHINVEKIDCAIIGCDAITPSFVVNGTPSLEMAKVIHNKIPLFVVGQTIKQIVDIDSGRGFDRIPNELITKIVLE